MAEDQISQSTTEPAEVKSQEPVRIQDTLWPALEGIERRSVGDKFLMGLPTGFSDLDVLVSGWLPGDLVIISGAPSIGKSALLTRCLSELVIGHKVAAAIALLECTKEEYLCRLLSAESSVDSSRVRSGALYDADYPRLAVAAGLLNTAPLFILDGCSRIDDIERHMRNAAVEQRVQLVAVDSLNLVESSDLPAGASRDNELSAIVRRLKRMAVDLKIVILATAHLSRGVNTRAGHRPELTDLRDSGEIENVADVVLFVHRPEYWYGATSRNGDDLQGKAELIIAKNRRGVTGWIHASFDPAAGRFGEVQAVST